MTAAFERMRSSIVAPVVFVTMIAWLAVVVLGRGMSSMPGTMGLGLGSFVGVWSLMMLAMMLPAVSPFASVYARTFGGRQTPRTLAFVAGYLIVWTAAAFPAFGVAWVADRIAGSRPGAATALAAAIFLLCGVYQLSAVKDRCLAWCRSPLGFTMKYTAYRGPTRDLRVGLHHGGFCLACCWTLMLLLVAFGVMNVVAMAGLACVVFAERTWALGPALARVVGIAALLLAVVVVFRPGLAPALHHAHSTMTGM